MTKKHFVALALALKSVKPDIGKFQNEEILNVATVQWIATVNAMADLCAKENYNFKRGTFLNACGF